ncbi:hypothetical protein T484DRAFT_1634298, partial [Baffinella frigidus]
RNPEPGTRNPEPGTRNPEPGTRNPEPGTRNPKTENRKPKTENRNSKPQVPGRSQKSGGEGPCRKGKEGRLLGKEGGSRGWVEAWRRCSARSFGTGNLPTQRATKEFSGAESPRVSVTLSVGTPPMSLRVSYRRVIGLIA